MKRTAGVLLVGVAMTAPAGAAEEPGSGDAGVWSLQALRQARAAEGRPWHSFVRLASLSAGLYVLEAGAEDRQEPHERDELSHVISGRAVLVIDDERFEARPGSIFFVRAEVPHRFVEIEDDLEALVFFGGAEPEKR